MAKRPHEDDDSSLDKDLMAMGISEDTKKSGGEHLKRQTEESINQDRKRHKVEKQSAASVKNAFEEENTSKECIIQQYSNYINHQSGIIDDLKCQLESARRQLEEHLVIIERLEKEKKDLTQRLSKQAGANLTYNSPNIADLSDENRPTKLAEDFSELYDNELSDAFESLCSKNEREKTQIMLEILKKSYELCYDSSQDHVNAVKNGFATLRIRYELGEVVKKSDEQASAITEQKRNNNARKETKGVQCVPYKTLTAQFEKLTKEQMKTVSDIRKYFESELTESFQKKSADLIAKSLPEDMQKKELVHKYIQKCLQICWSMCRHEPPVFIHFIKPDTDTLFDTNVLRPYTKTGKYVDYVVWPPLYLYKDGPMLSKGIAQGRK